MKKFVFDSFSKLCMLRADTRGAKSAKFCIFAKMEKAFSFQPWIKQYLFSAANCTTSTLPSIQG
jgi:hypothetical protein